MMTAYYPHQAAEIVQLCIEAGVAADAAMWLRDGYSVGEVAAELQGRLARPGAAAKPGPALAQPQPDGADAWNEVREANASRFASHQRQPGR